MSITNVGDIYPNTVVAFNAAVVPPNLTMPYTYSVDFGDGTVITSTASNNPLQLLRLYCCRFLHGHRLGVER